MRLSGRLRVKYMLATRSNSRYYILCSEVGTVRCDEFCFTGGTVKWCAALEFWRKISIIEQHGLNSQAISCTARCRRP